MKRAVLVSSSAATLLLMLAYGINGLWLALLATLVLGLLWLLGQRRGWAGMANLVLAGAVCLATVSILDGLAAAWTLPGIVLTLVAADLDRFAQRLRSAPHVEGAAELWRAHWRRLLLVASVGVLPAAIALLLRVELDFGWTLLLALLAIAGLSRAVSVLRRG